MKDLAQLSREVVERRASGWRLTAGGAANGVPQDLYGEELSQIEEELDKDSQRLQEYVDELRVLGVEPKNGPDGLVDFPAMLEGRPIYLCWKLGEAEVLHWHELDAGFRGRQALVAGAAADGSGSTDSIAGLTFSLLILMCRGIRRRTEIPAMLPRRDLSTSPSGFFFWCAMLFRRRRISMCPHRLVSPQ